MKHIKHLFIVVLIGLLFVGCASIPVSTKTLTEEVIKEADGMHQLNISLVNQLFEERKKAINTFVTNTYTPAMIAQYEKLLPDSLNYKKELPNIMKSIIPVINRKKDSLQGILNTQQQEIISDLNTNYATYNKAANTLQALIDSAVKIKAAETNAINSIQNLTGDTLDVKKIEGTMTNLLNKSGADMEKLLQLEKTLNLN